MKRWQGRSFGVGTLVRGCDPQLPPAALLPSKVANATYHSTSIEIDLILLLSNTYDLSLSPVDHSRNIFDTESILIIETCKQPQSMIRTSFLCFFVSLVVRCTAINDTECHSYTCTLNEVAAYNATLQACACPEPQCLKNQNATCSNGQILVSGANNACACTEPCAGQTCQLGSQVIFNPITRTCLCPALPPSCNTTCSQNEDLQYNATTNNCTCTPLALPMTSSIPPLSPIPTNSDVLSSIRGMLASQSVTSKLDNGMAQIYSAIPDFYHDRINFTVVIPGSTLEAFPMTASATLLTDSVDADTLLILSPAHVVGNSSDYSKPQSAVTSVTQIIAVLFNKDKTINFHCQLSNGTVTVLLSDGYVQDIASMDSKVPPELAITGIKPVSFAKRSKDLLEGLTQGEEGKMGKRGIQDVNGYTTVVNEEGCAATLCTGSREPHPAMFNPYRRACYCQTF